MMEIAKRLTLVSIVALTTILVAAKEKPKGGKVREAIAKKYDANKDGKLDKEERAAILKAFDTNKNGKLDKTEKKALADSVAGKQQPKAVDGSTYVLNDGKMVSYGPKYTLKDWKPVKRTTEKIARVEQDVIRSEKVSWKRTFYRNNAYKCGLSGNYTFVVIEPSNVSGKKAPLWVYFHGGGYGYFDKDGKYMTLKFQNKDTYNHEETFETLGKVNGGNPVFKAGKFVGGDNTMTRRLKEGHRMLVVGYGDHDQYSGKGTPYTNNPKGGEVNGLQASMSAVEYTVANYPTTHVFAHGTSAGSSGAYALSFAFAQEGINLTGVVMDSGAVTPRRTPVILAMAANDSKIAPKEAVEIMKRDNMDDWLGTSKDHIAKVGQMIDPEYPFYPEAAVNAGFRSVPMLVVVGKKDPFYGARAPQIPQAKSAGLSNVAWLFDGLRQAIKGQKDSPHQYLLVNAGHVPTAKKNGHPVHNDVDKFIKRAMSLRKSYPFARAAVKE